MPHRLYRTSSASSYPLEQDFTATPFLKWAGGKSQLLQAFKPLFPARFNSYFEPFLGGAAVYFHLRSTRGVFPAFLSDLNQELIDTYTAVRDFPEELISHLSTHINDKDYFYALRAADTGKMTKVERAARLIFLNKTCFNGLYRVNRQGHFNVPFGAYKNPNTCNRQLINECSKALQSAKLSSAPFAEILKQVRAGDFVYLDPPYQPVSATSSFTSYTSVSFFQSDQEKLADLVRKLDRKGALVMVSNSDNALIHELYSGLRIQTVLANRAINCKGARRGQITELVITNY